MNDSREDLKTMDEPGSEDLISGDVNGRADINQNDADVTSMEVSSRKMLRNGDSEDDLVENGLPDSGTQDTDIAYKDGIQVSTADSTSSKDDDPSLIERKVNEIFDIFDTGGASKPNPTPISDTSSSFSLGVEEPHQTGEDSISESAEISFEDHVAPMSSSAAMDVGQQEPLAAPLDSSQSEPLESKEEDVQEVSVSDPISETKGDFSSHSVHEMSETQKSDMSKEVEKTEQEQKKEHEDSPAPSSPTPKPSGIPKRSGSPAKEAPDSLRNHKPESPRSKKTVKNPGPQKVDTTNVKARTVTQKSGYKPGGGNVKIMSEKKDYSNVKSRTNTGSRSASSKTSSGTESPRNKKETVVSPRSQSAQSKIGSMSNVKHSPGGGNVKILKKKEDYSKVSSRLGSMEKAHHKPGGGNVKIRSEKADFSKTAKSKIGSLENTAHTPRGGNVKIRSEKVVVKAKSRIGSLENADYTPKGGNVKILNEKVDFGKKAQSKVGSMDNVQHSPRGGDVKIESHKVDFKKNASPKIGSLKNASHQPGGGNVQILDEKLDFKEKAAPKVGSLNHTQHEPEGDNTEESANIVDENLNSEEDTTARADEVVS